MIPVTYIMHPLKPPTILLSFRFYNLMASSGPNPNVSFFQFQDIFNTALTEYAQRTGINIAANPITASLLPCDSSDAVPAILKNKADAFDEYRNGDWKVRLMKQLKPTVDRFPVSWARV
jgi:hypothetical protein